MFCYGGMVPVCLKAITKLKQEEDIVIDLCVISQLSPTPSSHVTEILKANDYDYYFYAEEASVAAGWTSEMAKRPERPDHKRRGLFDV